MPYSILSLDGGGTWALIEVRILQERFGEETKGHDVLKNFDLVIANSGGSLVLAALCANKPLSEIRDIFENPNQLQTIFYKKRGILPWLGVERFSTEQKKIGLKTVLGAVSDIHLPQLPEYIGKPSLQIVITGFDYDRQRAIYFRSNALSNMESNTIQSVILGQKPTDVNFGSVSLLDAIHASSNAPILFFDHPARIKYSNKTNDRLCWDGAIGGNNNPVASGILEALANGAKREDIRVVSLGTANTVYPVLYSEANEPSTMYDWLVKKSHIENDLVEVKKLSTAIVSDPPDAATFIANQLLELPYSQTNPRLIRINPLVKPILSKDGTMWLCPGNNWKEDDLKTLFEMDMAVTDGDKVQLISNLCTDFFEGYFDNQGIRIGTEKLQPILGHLTFNDALKEWKNWDIII